MSEKPGTSEVAQALGIKMLGTAISVLIFFFFTAYFLFQSPLLGSAFGTVLYFLLIPAIVFILYFGLFQLIMKEQKRSNALSALIVALCPWYVFAFFILLMAVNGPPS